MNNLEKVKLQLNTTQKSWLVTGCAGFIGSNLIEFLLNNNQTVVGLDNFSTGYIYNIEDVLSNVGEKKAKHFKFIEGDIADFDVCIKACEGVDIVLHQAALGSVPRSIANPINSNRSNITGFINMLTAAKDSGIKRFVYASSSSVYGDSKELPKVENNTGDLLSPYAVMKMTNELYGSVFNKIYGMETIGLRYFNVFGRRQDPNGAYAAVIPKWIGAMIQNQDVYINGDGKTSRDFTYIDNVIQANILAGLIDNNKVFGEAFNIAVGGRSTLNELYDLIKTQINNQFESKNISFMVEKNPIYKDFRQGDIRHSNADISKARNLIGYIPTHDIHLGIKDTIEWYIDNM